MSYSLEIYLDAVGVDHIPAGGCLVMGANPQNQMQPFTFARTNRDGIASTISIPFSASQPGRIKRLLPTLLKLHQNPARNTGAGEIVVHSAKSVPHPFRPARTMARMPDFSAAGRLGQALITSFNSASTS